VQAGTLGYVGTLSAAAAEAGAGGEGSGAGSGSDSDSVIRAALLQQRRVRGAGQQQQGSASGGRSAGNHHPLSGERPPHRRGSDASAGRSRRHLFGQRRPNYGESGANPRDDASTSSGAVSHSASVVLAGSSRASNTASATGVSAGGASPLVVMYRWYTDPTAQDCEHVFMGDSPYGWPVLFSATAAAAAATSDASLAAGAAEAAATASVAPASVVVDSFTMVDWTGPWRRAA
jgi:hypothetical protein